MPHGAFRNPGSPLLRDPRDVKFSDLLGEGSLALAGIPWDWNTAGRPGARFAPGEIRRALYSMRPSAPSIGCELRAGIVDLGDVAVAPGDWSLTRTRIRESAMHAFKEYSFTVFLGGDHSVTLPIVEALAGYGKVGLLVLDAHYDMRIVEEGVTSGSWLRELLESRRHHVRAVVLGVADFANPPYLAEIASKLDVMVVPAARLTREAWLEAISYLKSHGADYYYVSVDMDHLDQAYAGGVNAPTPLGVDPRTSTSILVDAMRELKPIGMDVVEVVPHLDPTGGTVRLAAYYAALALCLRGGRSG